MLPLKYPSICLQFFIFTIITGTIISWSILKASLFTFCFLPLSSSFPLRSQRVILKTINCFMQIPQWLSIALRIKSKTLKQALVYLPVCHVTKARHTDFCPSFFNTQSYFLPGNLYNLTLTLYLPWFPSTFCQTSSYASRLTLNITNTWRSCVEIDSLYFTLIFLSHLIFFSQ